MSRVIAVMFNKSCGQIINVGSDFRNYYAYFKKRRRKNNTTSTIKILITTNEMEEGFFKVEIKFSF